MKGIKNRGTQVHWVKTKYRRTDMEQVEIENPEVEEKRMEPLEIFYRDFQVDSDNKGNTHG